jgi:predicted transcriptional regulator
MDLISKYDLIEKIVQTTDESILLQVKHILDEQEEESWEDLDPKLKASLKRGLAQSDRGEVTPHEKIWPKLKKKYSKK